jgi:hypothetical protein
LWAFPPSSHCPPSLFSFSSFPHCFMHVRQTLYSWAAPSVIAFVFEGKVDGQANGASCANPLLYFRWRGEVLRKGLYD